LCWVWLSLSRDLIIYQLRAEIAELKLALERQKNDVSGFCLEVVSVMESSIRNYISGVDT